MSDWRVALGVALLAMTGFAAPGAAETVNVYTAWPESLSQPIFKAYTAKTGMQVNFIRLSTGELVARATAEKNNPRADVIWGAPGDGFAAAKEAGILEPYRPPTSDKIPAELKDRDGYYTAVSKNTLVFMSNAKLLKEKGLKPPVSWNDLLDPAYKGQIQTADARTSGTALTRILSIYYAFGKDEDKAFDYQKKLHGNVQVYTKSGGGCTIPAELKDREAFFTAVAKNTLVFMSNAKLLKEKGLKPPTSWNDLLDPAFKGQIQTADARTSGTALTRILSIYYAFGKDEQKAFDYQKRLHANVQVYTKSGGGCTVPAALGQAMVCIAHMPDAMEAKKKGYDMTVTFPREGVAAVIEGVALVKGAKNRDQATKFIDWTFSKDMQDLLDKHDVYMLPTLPGASIDAAVQALMKEAKLLPVDLEWVGKNRRRLVDRWVNEVIRD